jgi:hypothetical protein
VSNTRNFETAAFATAETSSDFWEGVQQPSLFCHAVRFKITLNQGAQFFVATILMRENFEKRANKT